MKYFLEKIKEYKNIVIFRHTRPDLDALGSQIGLKHIIKTNFEHKNVYVVGDMNNFNFLGNMDEIDDDLIKDSLAIIVDVADQRLVSDDRYKIAKERIVIDHHKNDCSVEVSHKIVDTTAAAATQIVTKFALSNNLTISCEAATALYSGMITDSGRFLYSLTPDLFNMASLLIENGADYKFVYKNLYSESLYRRQMKAYFTLKVKVNKYGFGYLINKKDVYKKFDVDTFTISRGMVGVMSDTNEIKIWANFTYDRNSDNILCEFRSKEIPIVDIAKKYGGGGHLLACGCTIDNENIIKDIIRDFNNLLKG